MICAERQSEWLPGSGLGGPSAVFDDLCGSWSISHPWLDEAVLRALSDYWGVYRKRVPLCGVAAVRTGAYGLALRVGVGFGCLPREALIRPWTKGSSPWW